MTSAQQRRETVQQLHARGLSLRRSCALCHSSRSSLRYRPRQERRAQNGHLVEHLRRIARTHPRYDYGRAHALVCRAVPGVNLKRVHRLWRQQQLSLPRRRPRKRRLDTKVLRAIAAAGPNQVWTYDFMHDACANGQRLKILTVTDECTRERLAIEVATTMQARGVIQVLERLVAQHGAPAYVRSDNGPACVAQAVQGWLRVQQVQTAYSAPGSPWQNAYGESFNSRLRDECLNVEWFRNPHEARVVVGLWRRHDNEDRPHSSLGYQTPQAFRRAYAHELENEVGRPRQIGQTTN